jgi:PAS domain S-box-containing protein
MSIRVVRALDASRSPLLVRSALGALIAIAATLLRLAIDPIVHEHVPFAIAIAASAVATRVAGVGGGIASVIVSAVLVESILVEPRFWMPLWVEHVAADMVFIGVASILVWQVDRWRKAEQALRESEANARETGDQLQRQFRELEAIYRSAPVGLCVLDREMRWIRLNDRLAEMNGFPVEAHIGKHPHELLPEVGESAEAALRTVIETGQALSDFELCGTTPAQPGVIRWWRERWAPIKDEHGAVIGVAVATEEITEQKRTEHALRAALESARHREAEISSIYDSAPIGLCIFDREGRYLRINRRLAELNGVPPEAHIGRTFHEVIPSLADQAQPLLRHVLDTGEPAENVEIRGELASRPGSIRTWSEQWYPIRDEAGAIVGVNVAVEEITDRKRVEQELREANQVKDDFLATLSHELRTPLNAILGWSQMLARGGLDDRLTKRAIETIFRNAQAQNQLVTDVLDVSRMMSGKVRLDLQEVDLVPLLREAIDSMRPAADAKQLTLAVATPVEPVLACADAGRIQQVFWNLLSNAVKFTEAGGRVTAKVARADGTITVTVQDTGIGIRPAFLPRVFDRFTQADSSTSRQHNGLGLGLSIVRHLVELHGGTVSAWSDGEGQGARFTVSLPARVRERRTPRPAASAAWSLASRTREPTLKGLRVLVLDDSTDARSLMTAILEHEGVEVAAASSAEEALQHVSVHRPDLIVADIGMPGVDGYEFLRRLRTLPCEEGGTTPAIAVTAYGGAADRAKVLAAGFLTHVPKPIVREHLLGALAVGVPVRGESG